MFLSNLSIPYQATFVKKKQLFSQNKKEEVILDMLDVMVARGLLVERIGRTIDSFFGNFTRFQREHDFIQNTSSNIPMERCSFLNQKNGRVVYGPVIDSVNAKSNLPRLFSEIKKFFKNPSKLICMFAEMENSEEFTRALEVSGSHEYCYHALGPTSLPTRNRRGICLKKIRKPLKNDIDPYKFHLSKGGYDTFALILEEDPLFFDQLVEYGSMRHPYHRFQITRVDFAVDFSRQSDFFEYVKTSFRKQLVGGFGKQLTGVKRKQNTVIRHVLSPSNKNFKAITDQEWAELDSFYVGENRRTGSSVLFYQKSGERVEQLRSSNYSSRVEIRTFLSGQPADHSLNAKRLPKMSIPILQAFIRAYLLEASERAYVQNSIFLSLFDSTVRIRAQKTGKKKDLYSEFIVSEFLYPLCTPFWDDTPDSSAKEIIVRLDNLLRKVNGQLVKNYPNATKENYPFLTKIADSEKKTAKTQLVLRPQLPGYFFPDKSVEELDQQLEKNRDGN